MASSLVPDSSKKSFDVVSRWVTHTLNRRPALCVKSTSNGVVVSDGACEAADWSRILFAWFVEGAPVEIWPSAAS